MFLHSLTGGLEIRPNLIKQFIDLGFKGRVSFSPIFSSICIISQNVFSLLASAPTAWNTLTASSTCGLAASAGVVTRNSVMAAARAHCLVSVDVRVYHRFQIFTG